jgi:hypothetical protein
MRVLLLKPRNAKLHSAPIFHTEPQGCTYITSELGARVQVARILPRSQPSMDLRAYSGGILHSRGLESRPR